VNAPGSARITRAGAKDAHPHPEELKMPNTDFHRELCGRDGEYCPTGEHGYCPGCSAETLVSAPVEEHDAGCPVATPTQATVFEGKTTHWLNTTIIDCLIAEQNGHHRTQDRQGALDELHAEALAEYAGKGKGR
jgi:hypothetical protein